jgi:hypothetical protein
LPALIACRGTQTLITETTEAIAAIYEKLKRARSLAAKEEAYLRDSHLITAALEKRIEKIRRELDEKSHKTPDEIASAVLSKQRKQKITYERDAKALSRALLKFTEEYLAGMLAAEELGGPVVGDLLDIADDILEFGFDQRGKAKKPKANAISDDDKQRRIDEIWGQQEDANGEDETPRSEREAAAAEIRSLAEDLLNTEMEIGTGSYVTLQRDSAAARFLVRAKAAQFHPKDARKLRLIDFSRGLEE